MLTRAQETYDDLRQDIAEYMNVDEPNERNVGIGMTESALAFAAAVGASILAREFLEAGWRTTLDRDPPKNPASSQVKWKEALLWGATSGAIVGLARIASRRLSSGAYRKFRT